MVGLNTLVRKTHRALARVGRGGKRGKTSGRGMKGQNARAGRKKRPEMRDIIKKLPKRRGYGKNRGRTVVPRLHAAAVTLGKLDAAFASGAEVSLKTLVAANVVARSTKSVKIVSTGEITKKIAIKGCSVSASAKAAVEKAGGTVTA